MNNYGSLELAVPRDVLVWLVLLAGFMLVLCVVIFRTAVRGKNSPSDAAVSSSSASRRSERPKRSPAVDQSASSRSNLRSTSVDQAASTRVRKSRTISGSIYPSRASRNVNKYGNSRRRRSA